MDERFYPVAGRFGVSCSETGLVWYVAEKVTPQGHWITHQDAFGKRTHAEASAQRWHERERMSTEEARKLFGGGA